MLDTRKDVLSLFLCVVVSGWGCLCLYLQGVSENETTLLLFFWIFYSIFPSCSFKEGTIVRSGQESRSAAEISFSSCSYFGSFV